VSRRIHIFEGVAVSRETLNVDLDMVRIIRRHVQRKHIVEARSNRERREGFEQRHDEYKNSGVFVGGIFIVQSITSSEVPFHF